MPSVFYQKLNLQAPIHPAQYQELLAGGWYRVQQLLMTTDFIMQEGMVARAMEPEFYQGNFHYLNKEVAPVFWLRINLSKLHQTKKHAHKNYIEKQLRCEVSKYDYRPIDELLYAKYRQAIDFDASPTLYGYLYDDEAPYDFFNSTAIRLFDGEELVACGIFDEAGNSTAGIINFFDPAYRKYSLGKWLIQKKISLALAQGLQFYYPGYFSTRIAKFDYKLNIAPTATEIWIREAQKWVAAKEITMAQLENYLIQVMASA